MFVFSSTNHRLEQEIVAAFKGDLAPQERAWHLHLSLAAVVLMNAMLPLIHLSMVLGLGYGLWVFSHGLTGFFSITETGVRNNLLALLPTLLSGAGMLLLLKPILARPAENRAQKPLPLQPQPLLETFVRRLAKAIGAPTPVSVTVDCGMTATLHFQKGLRGILSENLVLNLGLPLIAGLNMKQLAGVLAREFAHFVPTPGMRVAYLLRQTNEALRRLVEEPDAVDIMLAKRKAGTQPALRLLITALEISFKVPRKFLWLFMMAGRLGGSWLLHRLEHEADRYEATLVGSETFVETAIELNRLSWALSKAEREQHYLAQEGRLCTDFSALCLFHRERIDSTTRQTLDDALKEGLTARDNNHPTDRDRIDHILTLQGAPIFDMVRPATELLGDFLQLSSKATTHRYRHLLAEQWSTTVLCDIRELKQNVLLEEAGRDACNHYFGTLLRTYRYPNTLEIDEPLPPNGNAVRDRFEELSHLLSVDTPEIELAVVRYQRLSETIQTRKQDAVLRSLMGYSPLKHLNEEGNDESQQAQKQLDQLCQNLDYWESLATRRLGLALQLVRLPRIARRVNNRATVLVGLDTAQNLMSLFARQEPGLTTIRRQQAMLQRLIQADENGILTAATQEQAMDLSKSLKQYLGRFRGTDTPFEAEHSKMDRFLLDRLPDAENPIALIEAASKLIHKTHVARDQLLGRLTRAALAMEEVFEVSTSKRVTRRHAQLLYAG